MKIDCTYRSITNHSTLEIRGGHVKFAVPMGSCCSCEDSAAAPSPAGEWAKLGIAGVVAAQSMIFGLAINLSPPSGTARTVLHAALAVSALVVFALAGGPVVRSSWRAFRRGRIVFDQLFLLGMVAAFAASVHSSLTGVGHVYYEIVAILLAIHTFGGLLTDNRRREALNAAGDFGREFATCERQTCCGNLETVEVGTIQPGDMVQVTVGGAICVDAEVIQGTAFVRESALTGEPFPVVKRPGDFVKAGSYAMDGSLTLRATAAGTNRALDRLLSALEEARLRPSRLQREADRLASLFLPAVVLVAASTFAWWTMQAGWMQGLFNALAVILVACPCAMGIATPVAVWSALASFVRAGLTTKNPDLVEALAGVDTVVFDKTGTLGEEAMELVDFVAAPGFDRTALRSMVAAVEGASQHPIARAFRDYAGTEFVASDVRLLPGAGISGIVGNHTLSLGNLSVVPETGRGAAQGLIELASSSGEQGHPIYVVIDGETAGAAFLRETLRAGVLDSIAELEAMGLTCHVMTGDRAESASRHGLPGVQAGMLPEEKASRVKALEETGHRVLFVGDGINDSAAMQEASAALAIRGGARMAMESADGEIPGASLVNLPGVISRSRAAVTTIRGNLLFAAGYNVIGIALAACGLLHPVAASLVMLASSFTVTWRALREAGSRKVPRRSLATGAGWLAPVVAVGLAVQGPLLAWLGNFPASTAAGIILLFAAAGLGLFVLVATRDLEPETANILLMVSAGGVAMLIGWWADAGFGPVVREGVCLCNCANSTMGLGLFAKWNWMDFAMLGASLPMLIATQETNRWVCWFAGFAGMLIGMEAAMVLSAHIPSANPHLSFFAGYGSMLLGMVLGMILACGAVRRFTK